MKNKLVLATNNQHKLEEIHAILGEEFSLRSLAEIGFDQEIIEDGKTFKQNALIKAKTVYDATGLSTIADDSGLEIDALNGEPGIYSARYAETDELRIKKVLDNLKDVPMAERTARFRCMVCYYKVPESIHFFEGVFEGFIAMEPYGEGGFGYDPVFFVPQYEKTIAALSAEIKNSISHRYLAFSQIAEYLRTH